MPANASDTDLDRLLAGLNEPQRDAVVHGEGPLLILAGAGSGKTRVLTHRIAYLLATGQARPDEILAITFTNKAAQEMRERVELLIGNRTRAMWLMTFHAACARMLRAHAERLGYTRQFTIYDQADARRLVKRCIEELDVDPKRFTPGAIHNQISDAKNKLRDSEEYGQMVGGYFEQTVADVYRLYESELHRMNAMDFDDLLVRAVNVMELFPEVRHHYATTFRHVLVDEYQDTNHAQYRWLQLIAKEHGNLAVVGDDDQCLVEGTLVTMGDGSTKPIEEVRVGDVVLSSHGSGDMRPARVTRTHRSLAHEGIRIVLRDGREIVSTPEHTHFAGYRLGMTPQLHMTYVMHRADKGFRVGTSRTYTNGQVKPTAGVALRTRHEHADAAWVVGTHTREAEARAHEMTLSLRYGLPTLPFVARKNGRDNGLVGNQQLIDAIFESFDTERAGTALLQDEGFDREHPHVTPRSYEGRRRVLTVTLCADRRGTAPMHLVSIGGRDEEAKAALERIGLNVRPAKPGSKSWRYESVFKDFSVLMDVVERIQSVLTVRVRCQARLGERTDVPHGSTLPFTPAGSVRPGMAMFTEAGGYEIVESVERITLDRPVYDLDVERTHNFVAAGVITHNSVYGFRGADVRNILDFTGDFPEAKVVKLEQNYRSTQTILDAANAVISNNRGRMGKALWTDVGLGDPIKVRELEDEHAEARFVAGEIERLVDNGASRQEIAVFYRTNAQSRVLEDTLVRAQIGYQVIGGTKFYERAEIKDAIAYLTTLVNPQDVVAFSRVVNSPRRGIGATSLARVIGWANTAGITIWEAAAAPDSVPGLGAAAVKAFHRFMGTMRVLKERAESGAPISVLLNETLRETGYLDALEAERTIEAQGRTENLEELVNVAAEYDAGAPAGADVGAGGEAASLAGFLQQIALVADADGRKDDEGLVTLMTLHNAKGLEYPIVFLLGCEEGVFPHSRAIEEGGLEEERRLAYVGITRAERDLYVTYARTRAVFGARTYGLRSRFVDEIPSGLTDGRDKPAFGLGNVRERAVSWGSGPLGSGGGGGGGGGGSSWSSASGGADPVPSFRLGEDVAHPAFGDGVVTAVEAGGIVVIRFSRDGTERKLVADLAPITRR